MHNLDGELLDSVVSTEPSHPLAGAVTALRRVAFVLLLAGASETAVWFGNVRLSGSGGIFTSVAVGIIAGTLFLAATMAVLAYVLDLLLFVNASASTDPGSVECRHVPTA